MPDDAIASPPALDFRTEAKLQVAMFLLQSINAKFEIHLPDGQYFQTSGWFNADQLALPEIETKHRRAAPGTYLPHIVAMMLTFDATRPVTYRPADFGFDVKKFRSALIKYLADTYGPEKVGTQVSGDGVLCAFWRAEGPVRPLAKDAAA